MKPYRHAFVTRFVPSALRHRFFGKKIWILQEIAQNPDTHYSIDGQVRKGCIFFHIPKTGGLSVSEPLFGNRGLGHIDVKSAEILFGRRAFDSFYKFCFVRNPWDRVVSSYSYLRGGGLTKEISPWTRENILCCKDFEEFVHTRLATPAVLKEMHFRPQYSFVCRPARELRMDFVGRFERLGADFEVVAKRLGVDRPLPLRNVSTRDRHGQNYFTSETRDIVGEIYRDDIELFGYTFDG